MNEANSVDISKQTITRRRFIAKAGGAVSSFLILPRYVLGASQTTPPSDKLNVAIIGTGGRGIDNIKELIRQKDAQVMAVCDVTEEADYSRFYYGGKGGRGPAKALVDLRYSSEKATEDYNPCTVYIDFRKMFDAEKSIDAVVIATPDHTHAITALEAFHRGKHVYCEKPLARTVYEARAMTEAARKAGVATQMGNQGHSGEGIRQTVEWIKDGAIGQINEVHSWSNGINPLGLQMNRPKETPPVPEGMDWNLWIGPAPYRPYHLEYAPYTWRNWWDFGTGPLGDMACHNMDPAFWALDLGHPESVEASAAGWSKETFPVAAMIYYQFPARNGMPPVKLTWYSGLLPPTPEELEPGQELIGNGNGILFVGEKGKIMCPGWAGAPQLVPQSLAKEYKRPPKTLPRSKGHHRDWLDACKGGAPASANFDYSGLLAEVVLLGNVAIATGKKLRWDGQNLKAANCPEADPFIRPEYQNGWKI
ncbi:MAG: Gfo/Idh/MocA family oxidoreductase [Candidatus Omnitrophota bacterium]